MLVKNATMRFSKMLYRYQEEHMMFDEKYILEGKMLFKLEFCPSCFVVPNVFMLVKAKWICFGNKFMFFASFGLAHTVSK